jgi:hypothetical protein
MGYGQCVKRTVNIADFRRFRTHADTTAAEANIKESIPSNVHCRLGHATGPFAEAPPP